MFGWLKRKASEADRMGRLPTWYAAMDGRTDELRTALQSGLDVNHADENGLTMLGVAANYGRDDVIRLLLENGADPNLTDGHGNGPLWAATREATQVNHPEGPPATANTVRLLLEGGADPNHPNKGGRTPAGWAALVPELQDVYRAAGYDGIFEL